MLKEPEEGEIKGAGIYREGLGVRERGQRRGELGAPFTSGFERDTTDL